MESTNESKQKKLKIIIVIMLTIIIVCSVVLGILLFLKHKNSSIKSTDSKELNIDDSTSGDEEKSASDFNIKNVVSVGKKDEALYLITDTLESAKIYEIANYYGSEVIIKDEFVYINYDDMGNTQYVDVINLKDNYQTKVTIDEIKADHSDKDFSIYYLEKYKGYMKNLKTGEVTPYEKENNNNMVAYNSSNTSIRYNKDVEAVYDLEYIGSKVIISNNKTNDKKEIFKAVKENEKIENISMITDDILQISVEHISDKKPVWDIDEWHYYNFKTQEMMKVDIEGFSNIVLLHLDEINYDKILDDEDVEEEIDEDEDEKFDLSDLEDSKSTTDKRILKDLDKDIDEKDVIKATKLSDEDFYNYKEKFLGKNSDNTFADTKEKQKEYSELAERNFLVLENFILKSDELVSDRLAMFLNEKSESKYNLMYAKILSGMLNYYIGDINELDVIKWSKVPSAGIEIDLAVNSNYVMSYCFGDQGENAEEIEIMIYEGTTSFDDIHNNYNEYEDGKNTYVSMMIMNYDFAGYWDDIMNNSF